MNTDQISGRDCKSTESGAVAAAVTAKGPRAAELCRVGISGVKGQAKSCNCWHDRDNGLRKLGFKISDACAMLVLIKESLSLKAQFGLPIQRVDGKKFLRDDPRMITISYCPFCGAKL